MRIIVDSALIDYGCPCSFFADFPAASVSIARCRGYRSLISEHRSCEVDEVIRGSFNGALVPVESWRFDGQFHAFPPPQKKVPKFRASTGKEGVWGEILTPVLLGRGSGVSPGAVGTKKRASGAVPVARSVGIATLVLAAIGTPRKFFLVRANRIGVRFALCFCIRGFQHISRRSGPRHPPSDQWADL